MKNTKTIFRILIFFALILLPFLLWRQAKRVENSESKPTNHANTSNTSDAPVERLAQESSVKSAAEPVRFSKIDDAARSNEINAAFEAMNLPINFWGKVVDQDDKPLAGVKIKARVRTWHSTMGGTTGFNKFEATSTEDGRFQIGGANGDVLTIESVTKDGFEAELGALRGYGYKSPDDIVSGRDRPVVFRMWRSDTNSSLITGSKYFKVTPDGKIYAIDLIQGDVTENSSLNGDISVWIKTSAPSGSGVKYDWSFSIKAFQGGLIEEANRYDSMYLAPLDGYTNVYERNISASGTGWGDGISGKRFYIKSRDGQLFGRLELDIYASYGNSGMGRLWIKYALNPTGSRILK